ncbi:MAG: aspartate aminotransferase [Flavobacteriaceae bacterium]|nr:MAG: aspartate aminotransferase [Flavobacteriaceae bacterium]
MQISKRLQQLNPSATIAMTEKARELKAQGKDVISLSIGEPDFDTPDFIKQAANKAMEEGYNSYSPVPGYLDLREAICEKFKRDNDLTYSPNQIVVSTGAKHSIYNVFQTILNPGDEVIIPAPYWVSYVDMAQLAGGVSKIINTTIENDFKITPEQLEKAIGEKTKAFIFSSPCNPSGSVYTRQELEALAEVFAKHKEVIILSDEIYEHICYGQRPVSIASIESVYDQTVTINGLSKSFAMTGWRIGYLGAPEAIAKGVSKLQGQITSGTNCIAQRAAITACKANPKEIQFMVDAFSKRRDLVLKMVAEIPGFKCNEPKGAFYLFPDVSACLGKTYQGVEVKDSDDLAMYLLEKANVATVGGVSFGSPGCLRISYATSEDKLIEAFARIKAALS